MLDIEILDHKALMDTTPQKIACWRVKFDRIHQALEEDTAGNRGWDVDLSTVALAKASRDVKDWRTLPYYARAVNLELKTHHLNPDRALGSLMLQGVGLHGDKSERQDIVSHQLYLDGLLRLGIAERCIDGVIQVCPAAYAALCYDRADIREPIDRQLYESYEEIDLATGALKARAPIMRAVWQFDKNSPSQPPRPYLLTRYHYSFMMSDESLRTIGAETQREAWWHELNRDLSLIEQASDSL